MSGINSEHVRIGNQPIAVTGTVNVAQSNPVANLAVKELSGGSVTGVLDNVLTTIVTHTAATAQYISHISVSGTGYAKFQLFKNTVLIETRRSGPDRTLVFGFWRPLQLEAGDILDMKVTHYVTGSSEEFEATVYGG